MTWLCHSNSIYFFNIGNLLLRNYNGKMPDISHCLKYVIKTEGWMNAQKIFFFDDRKKIAINMAENMWKISQGHVTGIEFANFSPCVFFLKQARKECVRGMLQPWIHKKQFPWMNAHISFLFTDIFNKAVPDIFVLKRPKANCQPQEKVRTIAKTEACETPFKMITKTFSWLTKI